MIKKFHSLLILFWYFSLFCITEEQIISYDQVLVRNKKQFQKFFHSMLNKDVYLAYSAFESGFVSAVHIDNNIEQTLKLVEQIFNYFDH